LTGEKQETEHITAFKDLGYTDIWVIRNRAKNRLTTINHFRKHKTLYATQDLSAMVYFCVLDCLLCNKQGEEEASSAHRLKTQSA